MLPNEVVRQADAVRWLTWQLSKASLHGMLHGKGCIFGQVRSFAAHAVIRTGLHVSWGDYGYGLLSPFGRRPCAGRCRGGKASHPLIRLGGSGPLRLVADIVAVSVRRLGRMPQFEGLVCLG